MTTAFIFPGQASTLIGLPAEWARHSPHVRSLLEEAAKRCGLPVDRVISPAALARTSLFQPVLTALMVGITRELADCGFRPDVVAGHSLGELAACAAADGIRGEDAVAVAALRGCLMEREAARHPGGMIALPPGDRDAADAAVAIGLEAGTASLAARNASDRWVVTGDWAALTRIERTVASTRLAVAGPWHSPLIAAAADEYAAALRATIEPPLAVPIVSNRTGAIAADASSLAALLAEQLTHPVRWAESMATLATLAVTRTIVCGPGKALRRSIEEALPDAALLVVERPADLSRLQPVLRA